MPVERIPCPSFPDLVDTMRAKGICALIALTVAWPVLAQDGPSFDCAKALTGVEREICKSAKLRKADHAIAAAYVTLVGKLSGPARGHLIKDHAHWIDSRERGCNEGFL